MQAQKFCDLPENTSSLNSSGFESIAQDNNIAS